MDDRNMLAEQFELSRPRMQSVGYSMLGSVTEAEDAVQEAWLRLDRGDAAAIGDLRTWLTTVVARICLDKLRARKLASRGLRRYLVARAACQEPVDDARYQAELADSIGLALLVVLERLSPSERLAFVLHDIFALRFEESARSWSAVPTPPGSWRVGPGGGCTPLRNRIPTSPYSGASSTRSSAQPAPGTSVRC